MRARASSPWASFRKDGVFEAKQVLAKHDERYMPKEIADALKEQGEWRGDGKAPTYGKTPDAMIAEFGAFALILALAFAIAQLALSAAGRARRSTVLAAAGEGAALASFIGVALAFACLVYAFVTSDFSVANVAQNSHTEKPLLYTRGRRLGQPRGLDAAVVPGADRLRRGRGSVRRAACRAA